MGITMLLPYMCMAVGIFIFIRLRGFFILRAPRILSDVRGECRREGAFPTLMLALAGTLGVGNIVGVAVGISIGGAGSVFWLMFSSVFSAVIKYAEVTLSTQYGNEGMMSAIKSTFRHGNTLSKIYAALCLVLALTMGSALQSQSIGESVEYSLEIRAEFIALLLIPFVTICVIFGADIIEKIVKIVIPMTTIIYIIMCLCAIIPHFLNIGNLIIYITKSAFTPDAVAGGIGGFLLSSALREGFARGMLSNEAGAGTSSLAHSRGGYSSAAIGGFFGMAEVIFDTVILCPLTAFAILLNSTDLSSSPLKIISDAFKNVALSRFLIPTCIFFFAVSTILCWYYYGQRCAVYLCSKRIIPIYFIFFTISYSLGLFISVSSTIPICDIVLFFMSVITLSTIILNVGKLCELSRRYTSKVVQKSQPPH